MIAQRRLSRVLACLALVCIWFAQCHGGLALAEDSDALSVQLPAREHKISFRRLPKIADAAPLALLNRNAGSGDQEAKPYELPSVYLAEKELSLLELQALVSDRTWTTYTARVLAFTGTDDDPKFGGYRKAVREGSGRYPAILVDLATLLEACATLDKLASERPEVLSLRSDLSAVEFRIPSRIEWQYAARGTQDVAEAQTRELFPKWPQFDTELKGQWLDLCEKAGIDPGLSPSPVAVCEMADAMLSNKKSKEGYEFLGEVLKKANGFAINIFRRDDQNILEVDADAGELFGFRHLFGNASEWTIDRPSLEDVESLWKSLKQADATALAKDTRAFGVIMGGQFLDTFPQPRGWTKFSIADGQSRDGSPFSVQDAVGRAADGEMTEDFVSLKAGVRLCLRRSVSPQWFVAYRREARQGADVGKANSEHREIFRDLCIADEFDKVAKVLDAYQLAAQVAEHSEDASQVTVFTDSMIAAASAFDDKVAGPAGAGTAADEAIRRLQALGLGGIAGDETAQAAPGGGSTSPAPPKRARGPAQKPDFFQILGSVNRL